MTAGVNVPVLDFIGMAHPQGTDLDIEMQAQTGQRVIEIDGHFIAVHRQDQHFNPALWPQRFDHIAFHQRDGRVET